ncbi:DUF5320 domain-containing protein [Candidatus Peregrinibacteria bacterium]|nr:DUF5320 domain-containing protein [Candidatus Peregrinibacteria bacterium]
MPGFDGTGPMGQGPMTGWGIGACGGGRGYGCGYGRRRGYGFGGRGMGRGGFWRGAPNWTPSFSASPSDEKSYLKDEIRCLKEDLEEAQKRLKDLEKEGD